MVPTAVLVLSTALAGVAGFLVGRAIGRSPVSPPATPSPSPTQEPSPPSPDRSDNPAEDGNVSECAAPVGVSLPGDEPSTEPARYEATGAAGGFEGRRARDRHLGPALNDLPLGVVVYDEHGVEIFRNAVAERFAVGRHGYALVEAALERVVDGANAGLALEENVDLFGPPALNYVVQASPLSSGEGAGVVAVIDDVTEARHLDRVRSDFVANVSHELRTPAGALSVLADILVGSDDPEVQKRMATRIQAESQRLSDTLSDLLVLSRIESGPGVEPAVLDLLAVVTTAVDRTREMAEQRQVSVGVVNRVGGPILLDGDSAQLTSAVVNLLDNAIKYSDPGQTIEVAVDIEPVVEGGDPGPAVLTVVDSGIGIPQRDLGRVFERFYRVDTARSRETGGTGLGLSIVRHAIMNNGGSIDVASTEGVGTTFTVRLPLSPSHLQTRALFNNDPSETDEAPTEGQEQQRSGPANGG